MRHIVVLNFPTQIVDIYKVPNSISDLECWLGEQINLENVQWMETPDVPQIDWVSTTPESIVPILTIKLIYYRGTVDNRGRQEASFKPDNIYRALKDMNSYNDEMHFESLTESYDLNDLRGKLVEVKGYNPFTVNFKD